MHETKDQGPRTRRNPRVPAPVFGAFAEVSPGVGALADVIAISAVEARGMYKQRIWTAWGSAAHRGWARLLLGHCRDLIDHGPRTTRSAKVARPAMRSSSGTTSTAATSLSSSMLVPSTERAPEAPLSCHNV